MIDVNAGHGLTPALALLSSTTRNPLPCRFVVKHEDARSYRRRLQETLGLWIVDALDLVVVIEIMHRAAMPH